MTPALALAADGAARLQALREARWTVVTHTQHGGCVVRGTVCAADQRVWSVGVTDRSGTVRRIFGVFGLPGHVRTLADAARLVAFDEARHADEEERVRVLLAMVPIAAGPRRGDGARNVRAAAADLVTRH